MDMPAKIEFLKNAIASQQVTLRLQMALAALLFVLGITVVLLSFVNPGLILAESLKTVQALGGTVVAASGLIAIFFSRRDKIVALRSLLHSYQHQQVGGLSPDAKLDQYFDQYFAMVQGG
jgi:cytochrome c biogenesis protein CcdA